jgi:hypothetical protein
MKREARSEKREARSKSSEALPVNGRDKGRVVCYTAPATRIVEPNLCQLRKQALALVALSVRFCRRQSL